ncbi:hypothetical protein Dimus_004396 [Dionaea muscipula]
MAELQRSAVSFRRQGSSGVVWDDRFLSGEFKLKNKKQHQQQRLFYSGELARPNSWGQVHHGLSSPNQQQHGEFKLRPIKTGRSPADEGLRRRQNSVEDPADPPSPKLSACGCCGGFGRSPRSSGRTKQPKPRSA